MYEIVKRYTQSKIAQMSEGSKRQRKKRNNAKTLGLIVAVACCQTHHAFATDENQSVYDVRGDIGYWKINGTNELDFFGDRDTKQRFRALKKSGKHERVSSSTKRSKKSSKSSKKSSSSISLFDLGE